MYRPNNKCVVIDSSSFNAFGQPKRGKAISEPCAVVKQEVLSVKTSVKQTVSATDGAAHEDQAHLIILLGPNTSAKMSSIIQVRGGEFMVTAIRAQYSVRGPLDHFRVLGNSVGGPA